MVRKLIYQLINFENIPIDRDVLIKHHQPLGIFELSGNIDYGDYVLFPNIFIILYKSLK